MLNHNTLCQSVNRWAMVVVFASFVAVMVLAAGRATAQDALDPTVAPIEAMPVEAAPAEMSADNEVLFDADQGTESDSADNAYAGPDMGGTLGRFMLAVVVVLIVLAIVLMVYQKLSRRGIKLTGANRPLRIVDKLALAPKQWVCLLNVCDRYLLLGVAEKEINVLTEVTLPDDSTPDQDFEQTLKTMGIAKGDMAAAKATS